ncbi:DEAD/DEAH box helicase [Aerococcaceae bacterium NML160702]|nr:DEAD/DEAH box helicase [Aerococcaceae bacterium NML160702]
MEKLLMGRLLTRHEVSRQLEGNQEENKTETIRNRLKRIEGIIEQNGAYLCQRCGCTHDFAYIPHTERRYCLNCLNLGRVAQGEYLYYLEGHVEWTPPQEILTWHGTLSAEQSRASAELLTSLGDERPHLVYAVTGAGKTEMIFAVIAHVLQSGGRVCIASPRVDVCLELFPRLQAAFAQVEVQLLYGGQSERYNWTPLVVATTHQLWRFAQAFDLVIVDEVDAFPYVNDESLHFGVRRALCNEGGKLIFLTATPDKRLFLDMKTQKVTTTILPARYHGFALPEPQFVWLGNWRTALSKQQRSSRFFKVLADFLAGEGVKLIFMPDIRLAEELYALLASWWPQYRLACVHSQDEKRKEKVERLRVGELDGLISTTILERGVTFTNCQVCVIGAEDATYTESTLVQISGRVGRKADFPTGRLWYGHYGISRAMKEARQQIQQMNQRARERGLTQ